VETFFTIMWLGIGCMFAFAIYKFVERSRNLKDGLAKLRAGGFKVDHLIPGSNLQVAFNETERKVAFVFSDGTKIYDFSIIRAWQRTWTVRNGRQTQNLINITLRDAHLPLVKISGLSSNDAEVWDAKLGALLA